MQHGEKLKMIFSRENLNEINGLPLPGDDWQYHVSINNTAKRKKKENQ